MSLVTVRAGWRRWAWAGAAACQLAVLPSALQAAGLFGSEPPKVTHPVRSLFYGDALYDFYQDRYGSALGSLMVSQQLDRLQPDGEQAELLRGGLLLSHGLQAEAGQVFERLIDRSAEPAVRRRAWFYLARIRYQRGLPNEAAAALAHIDGVLPPAQQDERQLLQAQVQLALGQNAAAAQTLGTLAERKPETRTFASLLSWVGLGPDVPAAGLGDATPEQAGRYARYNLGVALIRSGDSAGGMKWLDELGQAAAGNEEMRSLRDQANLALGFAALQNQQAEQATEWLQRVRLNGAQSNKALLGLGWALLAQKKPKDALVPWTELAGRPSDEAAALEVRLALPYALAESGYTGPALAEYERSLQQFELESRRIDESIAMLQRSDWLVELTTSPGPDTVTPTELGTALPLRPLKALPYQSHLQSAIAQNSFYEALKDYRDLGLLARQLGDWQAKLAGYQQLLQQRQQAFATRLPELRQRLDASPALSPAEQARARRRLAALNAAEAEQAARSPELGRRLTEQAERVRLQLDQLAALRVAREKSLQAMAVTALTAQKQRLGDYSLQARLALAQLYDRAYKDTLNQGTPRATSP